MGIHGTVYGHEGKYKILVQLNRLGGSQVVCHDDHRLFRSYHTCCSSAQYT